MSENKVQLYSLPDATVALYKGVKVDYGFGFGYTLRLDYDRDGVIYNTGLRFTGIPAYRHRALRFCTPWHLKDTYHVLVEVENSAWVHELTEIFSSRHQTKTPNWELEIHHYMLCIDTYGVFEIAARNWETLPETEGPLTWGRET